MKSVKKVIILGGYGRAGIEIARLLLKYSHHTICLAGRDQARASRTANELNFRYSGNRVTGIEVNTALENSFTRVLAGYDLVIVAMPVTGVGGRIARAAFKAGVNYIDLNADNEKRKALAELEKDVRDAGLTFITEAGFVPGAPSVMVRYAAAHFNTVDEVTVGGMFREERMSYGSLIDMIPALGDSPMIFKDGTWSKAGLTVTKKVDFGNEHGVKSCYPMDLAELEDLPEDLHCRELGFFGSGVNWFFDSLIFLWKALGLYKTSAGVDLGARLLLWGNRKFTKPPYLCSVNAMVTGVYGGRQRRLKLTVEHEDSYAATAMAALPCVLGLLDGSLRKPGVHMMGHVLDPERYLENLWDMGMTVALEGLSDLELDVCRSTGLRMAG
jgi:saccharopine dehydrogenase (NAD+, L-lysine-forming)